MQGELSFSFLKPKNNKNPIPIDRKIKCWDEAIKLMFNVVNLIKMKLIKPILILIFLNSISCTKEEHNIELETDNHSISYELPIELKEGIFKIEKMLAFKSKSHFDSITYLLEEENFKYLKSYFSDKKGLSEDELEKVMLKDKFNPFLVYEKFEEYHNFNSLRNSLKLKVDEWLNSDEELSVINHPGIYPISERVSNVANLSGEYIIEQSIYRVEKNGTVYKIKNTDLEALNYIRQNANSAAIKKMSDNIIILKEANLTLKNTQADCKAYRRRTDEYHYADKRKMFCILDIDFDGYGSAAKAKVECYKYKKNWRGKWKWKRNWTDMGCQVIVRDYTDDCIYQKTYNSGVKYRDWAYYVSVHVYGPVADVLRVKPGELGGIYFKNGYNDYGLSW